MISVDDVQFMLGLTIIILIIVSEVFVNTESEYMFHLPVCVHSVLAAWTHGFVYNILSLFCDDASHLYDQSGG